MFDWVRMADFIKGDCPKSLAPVRNRPNNDTTFRKGSPPTAGAQSPQHPF
jgi:hypothetical protein